MSFTSTFRALNSRNFRLFFIGQGTSLIGTWMQRIATAWLVYRLTNSAVLLGVVGFVSQIPTLILSPFGGVIADRFNRKNIFFMTQVCALLQASILAALVLSGTVTIVWIIVLNIVLGIINALDMTARQSFMIELIDRREDLPNAIAMNSTMVNGARLLGPSITGILIAAAGEGVCFLINAASYLMIIVTLLAIKVPPRKIVRREISVYRDLREGFVYIYRSIPMRSTLLLLAMVSLVGMPYQVLMPVFAKKVLGGGPHTLGFLMGGAGLGALSGALYLASRKSTAGIWNLIPAAAALFGVGLISVSFTRTLWLSLPLIAIAGCGMMLQMASSNTLLQTLVDDDKRGRIMAFYAMAFFGTTPFGSLLAGTLADRIGTPHTVLLSGILCIIAAAALSGKIRTARFSMPAPGKEQRLKVEEGIEVDEEVTAKL